MKIFALIFSLFASATWAQSVTIRSGEHEGFTRLVLTLPRPLDWQLGRHKDGYRVVLAAPGAAAIKDRVIYDLSQVFRLIRRDRLQAIWPDSDSNGLVLNIPCACHIIPFEHAQNMLVLDIRDGPPPPTSSFELSLTSAERLPPLGGHPPHRPRARPGSPTPDASYNWLKPATKPNVAPPILPTLDAMQAQHQFRSALITAITQGVNNGHVDIGKAHTNTAAPLDGTKPNHDLAPTETIQATPQSIQGMAILDPGRETPPLMTNGNICPDAAALDLPAWGLTDAVHIRAEARAKAFTEFTPIENQSLRKAIEADLYFGFGSEARQLITSFALVSPDQRYLHALSQIVDGETATPNPFTAMESCDSIASLWAMLAAADKTDLSAAYGPAIARNFLRLPVHQRATLGSKLAIRLLKAGDTANAAIVSQAYIQSLPENSFAAARLTAQHSLHLQAPETAEAQLDSQDTGLDHLLILSEARFQQLLPLHHADLLALEAHAFDQGQGPQSLAILTALARAKALAGAFEEAFDLAANIPGEPQIEKDIWFILADQASLADLLTFAVNSPHQSTQFLPPPIRAKIAERLIEAGLPNAALGWIKDRSDEPELAARALLANNDPRAALRLLSQDLEKVDASLIAKSYQSLGATPQSIEALKAAGEHSEAQRQQRWLGDWTLPENAPNADASSQTSDTMNPDPWRQLQSELTAPARDNSIPDGANLSLASGHQALDQSAQTRATIDRLLAVTPDSQSITADAQP